MDITDREAAKKAASAPDNNDPEFSEVISEGRELRVELEREGNRHKETIAQIGWLTKCFGGKDNAPVNIAALTLVLSFFLTALCMIAAYREPATQQFWLDWSKMIFGIAGTALGFIFGRRG